MNKALAIYPIKSEATIRLGIYDRCKFWPVKKEFMLLELLTKHCVYQSLHTVVYCSDESPASWKMQDVHCPFRSWLLCVLLRFQVEPFCKRSCTFHTRDRKQAYERKFVSHAMLLNCLMLPPFFQLVVFDVQEVWVWCTIWCPSTRAWCETSVRSAHTPHSMNFYYGTIEEEGRNDISVGPIDDPAHDKCVSRLFRLCKRIRVPWFCGCVAGCVYGSGCDRARTNSST